MATLNWPPPKPPIDSTKLTIKTLSAGTKLLRIYDPKSQHAPGPRTFRHNGPRLRFDHHRGTKVRRHLEPTHDPDRGIYYAAFELSCAVAEVFGDERVIERGTFEVVELTMRDDLHVLDLRGNAAIRAGTMHAIGQIERRSKTWAWSRYFYDHPEIYGNVDGVIYEAAHNGKDAIALYERASNAVHRSNQKVRALSDRALELELLRIADAMGFPLL